MLECGAGIGDDTCNPPLFPMAKLIVKLFDQEPQTYLVGKHSVLIGRSADTGVQIDDPSVSACHAQLVYSAGVYTLTDLNRISCGTVN